MAMRGIRQTVRLPPALPNRDVCDQTECHRLSPVVWPIDPPVLVLAGTRLRLDSLRVCRQLDPVRRGVNSTTDGAPSRKLVPDPV